MTEGQLERAAAWAGVVAALLYLWLVLKRAGARS